MSTQDGREVAIHVSIKALIACSISLGGLIAGGAWSISATNTHVAEVLASMERLDARQDVQLAKMVDATKANSARLDVLDSRASRLENDVNELRQRARAEP
ncbi:MAG TPA: hypothetical protein VF285_03035 [Castellaniella sp.]|uniref:hypothetical protein n=1 Tax=Castellaniella sp. TaxID=1955812 RepID=UPI002F233CD7